MAEYVEVIKVCMRMCKSGCSKCPLYKPASEHECDCYLFRDLYPQQAEEIIMKWAEEHPIKTNADKFKEVFGKSFDDICNSTPCNDRCDICGLYKFKYQEYKEPKGE